MTVTSNIFYLAVVTLMGTRKLENSGGKRFRREKKETGLSRGGVQKENLVTELPV